MTTVDKVHEIFMTFDGKSPRQNYINKCEEIGCKINSKLKAFLSDEVNDFYKLEELDVGGNYFGGKGCLAVLPMLQCHQRLKSVNFRGCGFDDKAVLELVEILLDHPRLREIDLSDNPEISVFSGKPLVKVCKQNVNLITIKLNGTNIGTNVAAVVDRVCGSNRDQMEEYFTDHYFRMKDMFIGLDVDGSGWVNINTFVSSVVFPWIQERLRDRIQEVKPKKREDNCIDINTFMPLTYLTWKNKEDIEARIAADKDDGTAFIKSNWKNFLASLVERGAVCPDLAKMRINNQTLKPSVVEKIVDEAVAKAEDVEGKKIVNVLDLFEAQRRLAPVGMGKARPSSFYSGSSLKKWSIPSKVVAELHSKFGGKPLGVPAAQVLETKIDTELNTIELRFLKKQFNQYAIPMDDVLLTIQEIINMVDEYWDCVQLNKKFTMDELQEIVKSSAGSLDDDDDEMEH